MAREDQTALGTIKARVRIHVPTWAFTLGAGDGNRTRAVSLGSLSTCGLSWENGDLGVCGLSPRRSPPVRARNGHAAAEVNRTPARDPPPILLAAADTQGGPLRGHSTGGEDTDRSEVEQGVSPLAGHAFVARAAGKLIPAAVRDPMDEFEENLTRRERARHDASL
jgi:hypothetical protein